jgi:hypothetical protein
MTKKVYRRFLLAAIMLLMTASLIYTGPKAQAQDPCQECMDNCYALFQGCVAAGGSLCPNRLLQCNKACFYDSGLCTQ